MKQVMGDWVKQSMQKQAAMQEPVVVAPVSNDPAAVVQAAPDAAAVSKPADDQENVTQQVNEKLANMVQSGLLSLQGSDYIIDFKLTDGRLELNGKPFDSAMMGF